MKAGAWLLLLLVSGLACSRLERPAGSVLGTDATGAPIGYVGVRIRSEGSRFYALGDSLWWVVSGDNTGMAQVPAGQPCYLTLFGAADVAAVRAGGVARVPVEEDWQLGSRWHWRFWRFTTPTAGGVDLAGGWVEAWPSRNPAWDVDSHFATVAFTCDDAGWWRVAATVWDDNGDSLSVPPGRAATADPVGAVFRVECESR
jgi:hypothetical protein